MASIKTLAKDTAIYGLSSIVGRFLNYLLVPLYTHVISAASGGYGIVTNLYAYTALILVILTFGMETTFFRFANKEDEDPHTVFSTSLALVSTLSLLFLGAVVLFATPISQALGYADHPDYLLMMAAVVALDAIQAIPFCLLRFQKKAMKFAGLKLLFIVLNIGLNLLYFVVLGHTEVFYVFFLNLVCTFLITFFFVPELIHMRFRVDFRLLRRMFSYSWPILILGIAGILNQAADKMIFPLVYPDKAQGISELAVYGACAKIAMIMAMITQAFRYAYEPFVFAQSRERGQAHMYAMGMKYFLIFTLLAFLCVMAWLPALRYMVGADYWQGLRVVPIVMAAEIMMGVYFNLSFWYKREERTSLAIVVTGAGLVAIVAFGFWLIPLWGYYGAAWARLASETVMVAVSWWLNRRYYPTPYDWRRIGEYVAAALAVFAVCEAVTACGDNKLIAYAFNIVLFAAYALYLVRRERIDVAALVKAALKRK